jgi:hypothetical protein
MGDFRVWGRIEHIGPQQFVAIASAIPDEPGAVGDSGDVRLQMLPDREGATLARDVLVKDLGEALQLRGDRIVEVETD